MIVCSCNVLTDQDVRNAVTAPSEFPRSAQACCAGCPHNAAEQTVEYALAAA